MVARPSGLQVPAPRYAAYLDLENLLHEHRVIGQLEVGLARLERIIERLDGRGVSVARVAVVNASLQRELAFAASRLGIRVHSHRGGRDAADRELLELIRYERPRTCDVVVIGSGDGIFAAEAIRLRRHGIRVEVVAQRGHIAGDLYRWCSEWHEFPGPQLQSERVVSVS